LIIENIQRVFWEEMSKEPPAPDEDLFLYGVDSLMIFLIISTIEETYHCKVSFSDFHQYNTIEKVADEILSQKAKTVHTISAAASDAYYPLSYHQQMVYAEQKLNADSVCYNIAVAFRLDSSAEIHRFEKAINKVIEANEILRTSFHVIEGAVKQKIHNDVYVKIESRKMPPDDSLHHIITPFSLEDKTQIKLYLLEQNDENKRLLILNVHHIILDGISLGLLMEAISDAYFNLPNRLGSLQFKDFAVWQDNAIKNNVFEQQKEYWHRMFEKDVPVLNMKTDFPRQLRQGFQGDNIEFCIDTSLADGIRKMIKQNQISENQFFLSAYAILLNLYTAQTDFVIGSVVHGRNQPQLQKSLGMFNNFIPLRLSVDDSQTVEACLHRCSEVIRKSYSNIDYPYNLIIRDLKLHQDQTRNPLFDTMLIYHSQFDNYSFKTANLPLIQDYTLINTKTAKLDFKFDIYTNEDGTYRCCLEYSTNLFRQETMAHFSRYFHKLLCNIVRQPAINVKDINLHTEQEQRDILKALDNTEITKETDKNYSIVSAFENQAADQGDKTAIKLCGENMSYKQLNQQADRLQHMLVSEGVKKGDVIALQIERSLEMIVAIIGVIKAGGIYLPIAQDSPKERMRYILENSGAKYLLSTDSKQSCESLKHLSMADRQAYTPLKQSVRLSGDDGLYIIYTSGTTGKPKGVMVTHGNVLNLIMNKNKEFSFGSDDVWTMFHNYYFDFSVWEMYGALLYGGTLVLVPEETVIDSHRFLEQIRREKVTVLNQTPTAFKNLIHVDALDAGRCLQSIRYVIFGGEALHPAAILHIFNKYDHIAFVNMYGITETTVHVSFKKITRADIAAGISNIGKPIPGLRVLILDMHMRLVPIGAAGELCVGGRGVSRGYVNSPELSAKQFIEDPFHTGEILYRSGDFGRMLGDGEIEYLRRNDHQVQIHGFRIEISEVEQALIQHKDISAVVVLPIEAEEGDTFLCAYFAADKDFTVGEIKAHLSDKIPAYMMPLHFVYVERMPMTKNAKVDKKMLPPPISNIAVGQTFEEAGTQTEYNLTVLWKNLLHVEQIGVHDRFFEIGGNSISAVTLVCKLAEYRVVLTVMDIYNFSTIRELGALIDKNSPAFKTLKPEANAKTLKKRRVKMIDSLTGIGQQFDWMQLDCWHRPVGIILGSFQPCFGDILYFNSSFYNSFFLDAYGQLLTAPTIEIYDIFFQFYEKHLREKLGVAFSAVIYQGKDMFHKRVIELLEQDCPVLIPVDLYEIYYSRLYLGEHHMHYIIIKGYDADNGIYYILDCEQVDYGTSTCYNDFILKFDDVYNAVGSYLQTYHNKAEGFFWYAKLESNSVYDRTDCLMDHAQILEKINHNHEPIVFLEKEIIHMHQSGQLSDIYQNIVYLLRFKDVYYSELLLFIHETFGQDSKMKAALAMNALKSAWGKIQNQIFSNFEEGNAHYGDIDSEMARCIILEESFRNLLIEITKGSRFIHQAEDAAKQWKERNHGSGVILMNGQGLQIRHSFDKIDYTWFNVDKAPQMLWPTKKNSCEFSVCVHNQGPVGYRYHAGIIVRLISGMKFIFGNYRQKRIDLSCPEIDMNMPLKAASIKRRSIYLKVTYAEDLLAFFYKYHETEQYIHFYQYRLIEPVIEIGIISNKWDLFQHAIQLTDIFFNAQAYFNIIPN
jgi:amino acid adenylation domain-containing protein